MLCNPNDYPVYPEDDGTDRPRNPYSPVTDNTTLGPLRYKCWPGCWAW